jgi:hypothetical protein
MGNSMAGLTGIDNSTDLMANGIYLASLGSSLGRWFVGLDCKSCLSLFNHYGVFTLAQLFCKDISHSGLAMVRDGQFGQNMSELQQQRLAMAADGVCSVFAVLTRIVNKICSGDYESCADVHITSIDQEEAGEFSEGILPRMLTTIIDQTCQQNLQIMIHSPKQLGLIVSSQQSVKTADGRSRHKSLEPGAAPLTSTQIPPPLTNKKRRSESSDEHTLLDELQDLRDLYTFTYGARPRGPRGNIASWLHGRIQVAQFDIMDDNAAPGNQSEYTECMSNTLAYDDNVCPTIVTRAAQQVIDLTVNRACSVNDNNLAQSSPKRQRISDDAMIMKASMKAPPDAEILELKNEYKARFGRLPRGRFASTSSWLASAIAAKNRLTSTTQSIAHVSTPQTLLIPETTSDPPHIGSQFGRKWLAVGLSTIPAFDYSFAAGDKGMTFEASTAGSVHIKTIGQMEWLLGYLAVNFE